MSDNPADPGPGYDLAIVLPAGQAWQPEVAAAQEEAAGPWASGYEVDDGLYQGTPAAVDVTAADDPEIDEIGDSK